MNAKPRRRLLAIAGCAVSLGGTALAVAPSAAFAASTCPNKSLPVTISGNRKVHIPVKAITIQGLTCAQAYPVIALIIEGKTPKAWKYDSKASFKVPEGLVPQEFKASGGRMMRYGVQGG